MFVLLWYKHVLLKPFLFCLLVAVLAIAGYYFYPYQKIAGGTVIDKIVVIKSEHKLMAYSHNTVIKTFTIAIGKAEGKKQTKNDLKTPEGFYFIDAKNPNSGYHKNLGISYPNATDMAAAKKLGKPTGGDVKIHGLKNGMGYLGKFHRWRDWTNGCIALTDEEIDDLYEHVAVGTPVIIEL